MNFLDRLIRKYTPDPFLLALLLTFIVGLAALGLTEAQPRQVIEAWGDGLWSLLSFTLQMCMILVGGFVVASSPVVKKTLKKTSGMFSSPSAVIVVLTLVSAFAAWLNWGLGLVVGAFFALEMGRAHKNIPFPLLVASAYSGFLLWHGGLSGSIPLALNTEGNFSQQWVGSLIPLGETLFSPFNFVTLGGLLVLLPLTNWFLYKKHSLSPQLILPPDENRAEKFVPSTPAEKWENSPWLSFLLFLLAASFLVFQIQKGAWNLDLNTMNFIFLFLGLLLHKTPRSFLKAIEEAAGKLGPLLVQYPLYAGIMSVMAQTGLAKVLSESFVSISNPFTFPWLTFLSAGLVNFFVPSGGGQWAVQAPIVIPAAQALGAHLPLSAMAVAWGDAWTNMIQPFWALPLLAIAGIQVREILGHCLVILMISGIWISLCFLAFASVTKL